MIVESQLPMLIEDTGEIVIVRDKANKVLGQAENTNKVASREITIETMLVDDEIYQPTMDKLSGNELSTPERPSGPSLEEQFSTHSEPKSQEFQPSQLQPSQSQPSQLINRLHLSIIDPASITENAASLTTSDIQPSNLDAATQSVGSYEISEHPSTPERPSGPSLEVRTLQPYQKKPSNVGTGSYQPCTYERPSGPLLEEQFQDSNSYRISMPAIEVHVVDSEVTTTSTSNNITTQQHPKFFFILIQNISLFFLYL